MCLLTSTHLQALNARKSLVVETLVPIIDNVAAYLECLPLEAASPTWSAVIPQCDIFLRKLIVSLPVLGGVDGLLRTMACLMRLPGISAFKVRQFLNSIKSRPLYNNYIVFLNS